MGNDKMNRKEKWQNEDSDKLFKAVLVLKNVSEAEAFFRDLLTEKEILEFSQRWKVARMLSENVPYSEIGHRTWMTPRTIARIQKWLKKGKGGYRLMIHRLEQGGSKKSVAGRKKGK